MKNVKARLTSAIAVLLIVIAIIAVSYAMFTANLTGTKENKLIAGNVDFNCIETNFTLENTKVLTDEQGIALSNNSATCSITSNIASTMNIGYDIALYDITTSPSIDTSNVKIMVSRSIDGEISSYIKGTGTTGVLLSTLASSAGTYDDSITSYTIDSNSINGSHNIVYTIKGWLASENSASVISSTNSGVCSSAEYTTESECRAAGEIWGDESIKEKEGETFSFKIKLGATHIFAS